MKNLKPQLISEDQALAYLDGLYYKGESGLENYHFPFIVLFKGDVHIEGDLTMDWFEDAIKGIAKYDFALLIVEGNLIVDGTIEYDRGIPFLHVTGEIKSNNDSHPIWED